MMNTAYALTDALASAMICRKTSGRPVLARSTLKTMKTLKRVKHPLRRTWQSLQQSSRRSEGERAIEKSLEDNSCAMFGDLLAQPATAWPDEESFVKNFARAAQKAMRDGAMVTLRNGGKVSRANRHMWFVEDMIGETFVVTRDPVTMSFASSNPLYQPRIGTDIFIEMVKIVEASRDRLCHEVAQRLALRETALAALKDGVMVTHVTNSNGEVEHWIVDLGNDIATVSRGPKTLKWTSSAPDFDPEIGTDVFVEIVKLVRDADEQKLHEPCGEKL